MKMLETYMQSITSGLLLDDNVLSFLYVVRFINIQFNSLVAIEYIDYNDKTVENVFFVAQQNVSCWAIMAVLE